MIKKSKWHGQWRVNRKEGLLSENRKQSVTEAKESSYMAGMLSGNSVSKLISALYPVGQKKFVMNDKSTEEHKCQHGDL